MRNEQSLGINSVQLQYICIHVKLHKQIQLCITTWRPMTNHNRSQLTVSNCLS